MEPEPIVADQQSETEPVEEPETPQISQPEKQEPVAGTVDTADAAEPDTEPVQEVETLPEPETAPETPVVTTPEPEPVVETPEIIPDAPADSLSGGQQYEETPEQGAEQIPETEPETTTIIVYITNTGKSYHSAGCRHLKESCVETTLDAAKASGLTPCGHCHPPQ